MGLSSEAQPLGSGWCIGTMRVVGRCSGRVVDSWEEKEIDDWRERCARRTNLRNSGLNLNRS
jgi:hypothetical protein